jgi:hypothetical protein
MIHSTRQNQGGRADLPRGLPLFTSNPGNSLHYPAESLSWLFKRSAIGHAPRILKQPRRDHPEHKSANMGEVRHSSGAHVCHHAVIENLDAPPSEHPPQICLDVRLN